MIRSMTGFGRGKYENEGREYLVEIKSINHKYCDVGIRLPRLLNGIEYKIRQEVASKVSRGKIDVYIEFRDNSADESSITLNKDLAKVYIKDLKELGEETGIDADFNVIDIAKMPDVLKREDENDEDLIFKEVCVALSEALDKFLEMRGFEGNKLREDIEKRLDILESKILEITQKSTGLVDEYIVKLEERIKEILRTDVVDEARLAQEVVIYSDKVSVEEELTRLKSHVSQFRKLLQEPSPIGKKLDFLTQEINRETNTIGSKTSSLEVTNLVVDLKTEIENIREQIQNIE
ncbi:MAG: YicC family protein [Clostridia bacterium]|nr:YicC family protein [Clostridia bacterium]